MSVERVYVEAPVAEAFTAKLVERDARAAHRRQRAGRRDRLSARSPARARSRSSSAIVADARRQRRARAHRRRRASATAPASVLRADGARRRRPLDGDHARGDVRPGGAGDGGGRRRRGGAAGQRQPLRAQRQRLDARRRARHRASPSGSRAATPASTNACSPPACRRCPSAASSRAASARATAAPKACASSACARRCWSSRAGARDEPAWFPYSPKRARQIERLMGWIF